MENKHLLQHCTDNSTFVFRLTIQYDGSSGYEDRGFNRGAWGGLTQVSGKPGLVDQVNVFRTHRSGQNIQLSTPWPWRELLVTNETSGQQFTMIATADRLQYNGGLDNANYMQTSGSHNYSFIGVA